MKPNPLPSQEEVCAALYYDPHTGIFIRKSSDSPKATGKIAGTLHHGGYLCIRIGLIKYYAHRLAWIYVHGIDPHDLQIDHINGIKTDNRICNLRLATNSQNKMNGGLRVDNKSGVKGVSWNKRKRKWSAHIAAGEKKLNLGNFDSILDAERELMKYRKKLHGEFARHS